MITVMGGTGQVGGKIAALLEKKRGKIRIVARSVEALRNSVSSQTQAMAGDALDTEFLVRAFEGSPAVFTIIPPNRAAEDYLDYADKIGSSIADALRIARVRWVVNLSSVGAELSAGTGPITGLHNQEERLNSIPGLNVLHLRAGYFMENLVMQMNSISTRGIMESAIKGDLKMPLVATRDIAAFAAARLRKRDFSGSMVRYLLGPGDISFTEIAMTIGIRIGKPNLRYQALSYADAEQAFRQAGASADVSKLYTEMDRAFNEGRIASRRTSENSTETTFTEFCAQVFVPLYLQMKAA